MFRSSNYKLLKYLKICSYQLIYTFDGILNIYLLKSKFIIILDFKIIYGISGQSSFCNIICDFLYHVNHNLNSNNFCFKVDKTL